MVNTILTTFQLLLDIIANGVFQATFLILIILIYFLYKRVSKFVLFSVGNFKYNIFTQIIDSLLFGIIAGLIGSIIILWIGMPVRFTPYLTLLLPIALLLSLIDTKYLCFSYSAGIIGVFALIFQLLFPDFYVNLAGIVDVSGLIALVGILHLMEGFLVIACGWKNAIPIMIKKNGEVGLGYKMQNFWPIPFALLIFITENTGKSVNLNMPTWWPLFHGEFLDKGLYLSIISIMAVLGYSSICTTVSPQTKAKNDGKQLIGYSMVLLVIAFLSTKFYYLKWVGIIIMPILHEWIIVRSDLKEKQSEILIKNVDKGVCVVKVIEGGHGEKMGIKVGDIIKSINNIEVLNYKHMRAILSQKYTFVWLTLESPEGSLREIEYKAYPKGLSRLNIIPFPQNPRLVLNLDYMKNRTFLKGMYSKKK